MFNPLQSSLNNLDNGPYSSYQQLPSVIERTAENFYSEHGYPTENPINNRQKLSKYSSSQKSLPKLSMLTSNFFETSKQNLIKSSYRHNVLKNRSVDKLRKQKDSFVSGMLTKVHLKKD